uniref:Uncharacterized protein n=1 Tax=Pararge aegeria TaxID=116150 RepID=S4NNJ5_9NEOP
MDLCRQYKIRNITFRKWKCIWKAYNIMCNLHSLLSSCFAYAIIGLLQVCRCVTKLPDHITTHFCLFISL